MTSHLIFQCHIFEGLGDCYVREYLPIWWFVFFVKKKVQQCGQAVLLSSMLPSIMVIMKRLPWFLDSVPVLNTSNDLLMISLAFGSVHQPSGSTSNLLSLSRISAGSNWSCLKSWFSWFDFGNQEWLHCYQDIWETNKPVSLHPSNFCPFPWSQNIMEIVKSEILI